MKRSKDIFLEVREKQLTKESKKDKLNEQLRFKNRDK